MKNFLSNISPRVWKWLGLVVLAWLIQRYLTKTFDAYKGARQTQVDDATEGFQVAP